MIEIRRTPDGSPATVDAADGCPCLLVEPCSPNCSCSNPFLSGGCQRCAKYGSLEQRTENAAAIAAALKPATVDAGHAEIVDSSTVRMKDDALQSPAAQRQIDALHRLAAGATVDAGLAKELLQYAAFVPERGINEWLRKAAAALSQLAAEVDEKQATIALLLSNEQVSVQRAIKAEREVAARDEEIARLNETLLAEVKTSSHLALAVQELNAEVARLRADAERYRWLRLRTDGEGHLDMNQPVFDEFWAPKLAESLDAAIDAARAEAAKDKP